MSNTARKARKRAGIRFTKEAKIATPFLERSWFHELVTGFNGRKPANTPRPRSLKKRLHEARERGFDSRDLRAAAEKK